MDTQKNINYKLAIIGDGQLAMMTELAFRELKKKTSKLENTRVIYFGNSKDSCVKALCKESDYYELDIQDQTQLEAALKEIDPDALGIEVEHIAAEALVELANKAMPSAEDLKLIQDKGKQKDWYLKNQIPTLNFAHFNNLKAIETALDQKNLDFPFVVKLKTGGFDGRGVAIVDDENDLAKIQEMQASSKDKHNLFIVEDLVQTKKELAVIVARDQNKNILTYPATEMLFHENTNQLESLVSPPLNISEDICKQADNIAKQIVEKLDFKGILAVEFLYDETQLYVNEIAPRTHNSGHGSIEAIETSQFEQYLRVLLGLPLGSINRTVPAMAMVNIIGPHDFPGQKPAKLEIHAAQEFIENQNQQQAISLVAIHWYGKEGRKDRKGGHLTVLGDDIHEVNELAKKLGNLVKVVPAHGDYAGPKVEVISTKHQYPYVNI